MNKKLLFLAMFALIATSAFAQSKSLSGKKQAISGQAFIVTKGSGVYKLALLEMSFYSDDAFEKEIKLHAQNYAEEYRELFAQLKEDEDRLNASKQNFELVKLDIKLGTKKDSDEYPAFDIYRKSALRYNSTAINYLNIAYANPVFEKLVPVKSIKTDADGRFQLELPAGKYIMYSKGRRAIGRSEEDYRWLLRVDLKQSKNELILNNDNLTDTNCHQCVDTKQYFK
jgi:hypothetical protein